MQPEGDPAPQPSGESNLTTLAIGQYVGNGRYELLRMLDKGGMSSVWLATDSRLHEKVALKFLPGEIVKDVAAFREMQKETTKSRKLSHPNVIRIYDLHESPDESPFISMEFIEGNNLHILRHQQPHGFFTWEQLMPWAEQLCDALTYAHSEGVIHRDLKPANIMLDAKGRLKLADFGIAMTVDESRRKGNSNLISGTPGYMSPQQLSGHPANVTDDIHALGATLYELLTGKRPFHSEDVHAEILTNKPKPLNEMLWAQGLTNDIPPEVSALIMACLAKDPAMRPASAKAVSDWLGLKSALKPTQVVAPAAEQVAEPTTPHAPRSNVFRWLLLMLTLAAAIGGIGIWIFKEQQLHPSPAEHPPVYSSVNSGPIRAVPVGGSNMTAVAARPGKPAESAPFLGVWSASKAGTLNERFIPEAFPNKIIFATLRQPDGKFLVGGDFFKIGTNNFSRIARFNPDGSLDLSFSKHGSINEEVVAMALLPDRKILIGGRFVTVQNENVGHLARLNPDGSLDRTFPVNIPDYTVNCLVAQPDGKILVSGKFSRVNPSKVIRNGLVRLNPDGSVDEAFNIGKGANDLVDRVVVQPDGKLILAGRFTKFHDFECSRIVRLTQTGVVDGTFSTGSGFDADIMALALQPDGNILVGGHFTRYNGRAARYITRLARDGSMRGAFGLGANDFVGTIAMEGNDRIWVGGNFTTFNGATCHRLVRVLPNGSIDPEFNISTATTGSVRSLTYAPNFGMLVGGNFTSFAGQPRAHLVMVHAGRSLPSTNAPSTFAPSLNPAGK